MARARGPIGATAASKDGKRTCGRWRHAGRGAAQRNRERQHDLGKIPCHVFDAHPKKGVVSGIQYPRPEHIGAGSRYVFRARLGIEPRLCSSPGIVDDELGHRQEQIGAYVAD